MIFTAEIRMPDGTIHQVDFLAASDAAAEEEIEKFVQEQERKYAEAQK